MSEQHRMECEARHVMNMPSNAVRDDYLAGVEKQRGKVATDKLRETIKAQWALRKVAA